MGKNVGFDLDWSEIHIIASEKEATVLRSSQHPRLLDIS